MIVSGGPGILRRMLLAGASICLLAAPVHADAVRDAVEDDMGFAPYGAGSILRAQLNDTAFTAATFVDTRAADQFAAGHIPGAINNEWRAVPARLGDLPATGMAILCNTGYCDTGSLSAQASSAARLPGRDNVVMEGRSAARTTDAAWNPE